jgi:probable addiction module antidote protein
VHWLLRLNGKTRHETEFSKWDVTEDWKTDEDMVMFLEACFEEAGDDGAFITAALGEIALARGMSEVAAATGLTREGLYKTLSKDGNPSFSAVLKVMKALGLKLRPEAA